MSTESQTIRSGRGATVEGYPMSSAVACVVELQKLATILSRPFFKTFSEPFDLSLNEWRVLVMVVVNPGSAAQDISEKTGTSPMNISRAVAGLKKAGRVVGRQDPENFRRELLWATLEGRELFDHLYPSMEAHAKALFEGVEGAEYLHQTLVQLTARAQKIIDDNTSETD